MRSVAPKPKTCMSLHNFASAAASSSSASKSNAAFIESQSSGAISNTFSWCARASARFPHARAYCARMRSRSIGIEMHVSPNADATTSYALSRSPAVANVRVYNASASYSLISPFSHNFPSIPLASANNDSDDIFGAFCKRSPNASSSISAPSSSPCDSMHVVAQSTCLASCVVLYIFIAHTCASRNIRSRTYSMNRLCNPSIFVGLDVVTSSSVSRASSGASTSLKNINTARKTLPSTTPSSRTAHTSSKATL
mmetsp:Transcript_1363/g.4934  ORF Transcript_1363/g.4934 Transcript_1363/m.4934 type:complete len:254 (-) Transcript_1363:236-997(-)